eukprot:SAG31_NODE_31115_length_372_cov_0.564103_1_plen_62_part_01
MDARRTFEDFLIRIEELQDAPAQVFSLRRWEDVLSSLPPALLLQDAVAARSPAVVPARADPL